MICTKEKCTGCGCCKEICPFNCIEMKKDNEGFFYPEIDESKCKKCNLCIKKCPANNKMNILNSDTPKLYATSNNNDKVLKNSSSGGMFYTLADYVLQKKGVVYASSFDEKLKLKLCEANNYTELYQMMGSKYIQSFNPGIYSKIKNSLKSDKFVLFVGCPCQVAGLFSFLGPLSNNDKLITVDLICHGVPSQDFFDRYIKELESKYNSKVIDFKFRTKEKGWKSNYDSKIILSNKKEIFTNSLYSPYMICFGDRAIYRESCYNCYYSKLPRVGDFTLGDFFGINRTKKNKKYYKKGISSVLLNNEKALKVFNELEKNDYCEEIELKELMVSNSNLISSSKRPACRDVILKNNMSIVSLQKKYCNVKLSTKIIAKMPYFVKKTIIKFKRMMKR